MGWSSRVVVAVGLLLTGCSENVETAKHKALDVYDSCLNRAASKWDDGKSDAATIATAIAPMCADEFGKVIEVNNPAGRKEFETAMLAKQQGFATTVVLDRRKARSSP